MVQGEHPNQGFTVSPTSVALGTQKKKVNIVAMGSSRNDFEALRLMETRPDILQDAEIWGINYMGAVTRLNRIIHVDPVHPYLGHAPVKDMCDFALRDGIPLYTSWPHPMYPNHVVYPFDQVVKNIGTYYLNGSVAYALALAMSEGSTDIGMWGADFSYPNAHVSESGRANVEFLMGIAMARGIRVYVAQSSTLLDAHCRQQPYGFFKNPLHPPSSGGQLMGVNEIFEHCEKMRQQKLLGPTPHGFQVMANVMGNGNVTPEHLSAMRAVPRLGPDGLQPGSKAAPVVHLVPAPLPEAPVVQLVPMAPVTQLTPLMGANNAAGVI